MTRDGSLAYYLAAWACGCFFMSVSLWLALTLHSGHYRSISQPVALQNFWLFCFFGWVLGAGTSVLGAFILRRVAHLLKLRSAITWVSLGSVLIVALVFALGELSKWVTPSSPILAAIIGYSFLQAPATILETGWWLSIPPGAVTALILFRVDRAFSPQVQGAGPATP
jgi:hypothetical protein